jgi:hypothetical protein
MTIHGVCFFPMEKNVSLKQNKKRDAVVLEFLTMLSQASTH